MKILHIIFSLNNAGKENMLVDIAIEQQRLGHDTAIAVLNNKVSRNILNRIPASIECYFLNRVPGKTSFIPFVRLFDILHRRFKPSVIHAHDAHLGKVLRTIYLGPINLTIHGKREDLNPLRYFNKIFAISKFVKADVESRSNLLCQLVYNGIRVDDIKRRISYHIKEGFRIINVARLNHEIKGQDLLIKGLHVLIHEKGVDNLTLDLVGDGDSFKYLEKMIIDLGLTDKIRFLGNRPREWVHENLCNYHLFVQPSRSEGFGLSVAEAMAAGVPVVASDTEGLSEILAEGDFGILFKKDNNEDLSEKIEDAIRMYRLGAIQRLADNAYQHCVHNFQIANTSAAYCKYYKND